MAQAFAIVDEAPEIAAPAAVVGIYLGLAASLALVAFGLTIVVKRESIVQASMIVSRSGRRFLIAPDGSAQKVTTTAFSGGLRERFETAVQIALKYTVFSTTCSGKTVTLAFGFPPGRRERGQPLGRTGYLRPPEPIRHPRDPLDYRGVRKFAGAPLVLVGSRITRSRGAQARLPSLGR